MAKFTSQEVDALQSGGNQVKRWIFFFLTLEATYV